VNSNLEVDSIIPKSGITDLSGNLQVNNIQVVI
jgi:hypothetical protein